MTSAPRGIAIVLALALISASACSSKEETHLTPPSDVQERLSALKAKPKFVADRLYPGAASETDRVEAEKVINEMIGRLAVAVSQKATRERALAELERTLPSLTAYDSEDRDQALVYIEAAMDVIGLETSGGLLNKWRYGFDPSGNSDGNGS